MKNTFHALTFLSTLFLLLSFGPARAETGSFKIKVFAEKGAEVRAQEFIDKLKATEPFKQLVDQRIVLISENPVVVTSTKCRGGNMGIERLAWCDMGEVAMKCAGSDRCPLFTAVPAIGAGGSPSPISSSSFPWTTMLHELLHTYGFSDEYAYTKSETPTYCGGLIDHPNEKQLAKEVVYKSEGEAREACIAKIDWCEEAVLNGSQVVTQVQNGYVIGSPAPARCPDNTIGVYLGAGCEKARPKSTYRPYFCPTVMGFPTIGQDYCEVTERHGIIGRMPNIIPPYYQLILFKHMVGRRTDVKFRPDIQDFPAAFSYGIPSVDNLPEGDKSQVNRCSKQP